MLDAEAGKMPAIQDRLEAYATIFHQTALPLRE